MLSVCSFPVTDSVTYLKTYNPFFIMGKTESESVNCIDDNSNIVWEGVFFFEVYV